MADVSTICSAVAAAYLACQQPTPTVPPAPTAAPTEAPAPQPTAVPTLPAGSFVETFDAPLVLEEVGSASSSASPRWWVNSGAMLLFGVEGVGQTVHGELPIGHKWQKAYSASASNRENTDNGTHPQNIARYVTRAKFGNVRQSVRFRIDRTILSAASERKESNGVLFFGRYRDGDNLYYLGIRVDGSLVIKSKKVGTYKTLAQRKILPGTYNRTSFPQLIPQWTWHTLVSDVETTPAGCVALSVKLDDYTPLSATDCSAPLKDPGFGGIRTDFMDVSLDDYAAQPR